MMPPPSSSASLASRTRLVIVMVLVVVAVVSHQVGLYGGTASCTSTDISADLPPLHYLTILSEEMTAPLPLNHFRLAIVADRDTNSAYGSDLWISNLRSGVLRRLPGSNKYKITWEKEILIRTTLNEKGRGLELSELVFWNNQLLAFDDRTGIVFELRHGDALPRFILNDGDGNEPKGFKCEWATLKDGHLYVGSMGKEWTTGEGVVINTNPQFIKVISDEGEIVDMDWSAHYNVLRLAAACPPPGYLIHEAAVWQPQLKQWFFLPRRVSPQQYDEKLDEMRGSNLVLVADEDFRNIKGIRIGEIVPSHGFSSVKFVPGSTTDLIALKSEEVDGSAATFITVFNLSGEILLPETKIGNVKFEGLEFIPDTFDIAPLK